MNLFADANLLKDTVVFVLAGGRGQGLHPLTQHRTKGAVPFGGVYRLIDFSLTNCLYTGLRRIVVLPQYKFASLERHLRLGWNIWHPQLGEYLSLIPPQQRIGENWYKGPADAVYQNTYLLHQETPKYVLILSSDHIYRMDYGRLITFHAQRKAELTVAALEMEEGEGLDSAFIEMGHDYSITSVEHLHGVPRPTKTALRSMGVYLFDTDALVAALTEDAYRKDSGHDFDYGVLPHLVGRGHRVCAYPIQAEENPQFYWRDVGTIDAYWRASMELVAGVPPLELSDARGPIHTHQSPLPPARVQLQTESRIADSLISPGSTITDACVHKSILSPGVQIDHRAQITESVLMEGVKIGAGAQIHRSIIDKEVEVPADYILDGQSEESRQDCYVSSKGIVAVPKKTVLSPNKKNIHFGFSYYGSEDIPAGHIL